MDDVEGAVSLWLGQASSRAAFDQYLTISSTEEGNSIPSQFQLDFRIRYMDDDFREAYFSDIQLYSVSKLLDGCSYDEVLIPRFAQLSGEFLSEPVNCFVLLYDFQYDATIKQQLDGPVALRFVGAVSRI